MPFVVSVTSQWAPKGKLLHLPVEFVGCRFREPPPSITTEADAPHTVSAWVRLTRGDLNASVASQNGATKNAFKLAYAPGDGKWRFVTYDSDSATAAEKRAVSNRSAKLNEWTHLAGVYDAGANRIRLYENGELVAANTVTGTFNATGGFLIGRSQNNGAYE
ncbi:Concanavalin A-like lectin/glucanases superfamily protein [Sinosporangium album]|uniref:Concanavalin A-like lectin/glucanases superfamily protein n=1 Tax=Sinosporangium album TaxID=504805 RepID=A0A1G8F1V6_9ACTN|nr:LamG domain-containing protein [Sinosporangium album]SDH75989.1 Concanavalin A-like lectin/glucanases superfamily protein [Sinosporangium album]